MWRGFIIESYSYVNPKGALEHIKFLLLLLPVYIKFKRSMNRHKRNP